VYLLLPAAANEVKRLVGWQKVSLVGGQLESVTVTVNANDSPHPLAYWNATNHAWTIASGRRRCIWEFVRKPAASGNVPDAVDRMGEA